MAILTIFILKYLGMGVDTELQIRGGIEDNS